MKVAILFCLLFVYCSSWMLDDFDDFSAADLEPSSPGDRWWWAPSRKAHLYSKKYQPLLKALMDTKQGEDLRLPRNFIPYHYNVILTPILEEGNFTTYGSIQIDMDCVTASNQIVLNSADLLIKEDTIKVLNQTAETTL